MTSTQAATGRTRRDGSTADSMGGSKDDTHTEGTDMCKGCSIRIDAGDTIDHRAVDADGTHHLRIPIRPNTAPGGRCTRYAHLHA